MKERQHWHPAAPFRLANGALAEGRPDLTMLMNAREPHESLVREHQVEKAMKDRLDGSGRLAAAQVPRPKTRQPTFNYGRPSDAQLAEFLGADVPHDMIGSTFDRLRDPIPDVQIAPPQLRPNAVARPPSRTGDIRRYKDETVAKHASGLHSQTQHDLNRTAFDPLVPMLQPEPVGHYVRVGVPVAIANQSQPVVLIQDERPASFRSGLQASAMHSGMQLPPASPIRSALGPSDSALLTASQVSFRHATADLPPAAVVAAKRLLDEHRPITVAGLHQRRPPYKDIGPLRPDDAQDVHPDNFQQLLRKNPEIDALGQKRKAFVVGSAAPWQRHKDFQTFEVGPLLEFEFADGADGHRQDTQ